MESVSQLLPQPTRALPSRTAFASSGYCCLVGSHYLSSFVPRQHLHQYTCNLSHCRSSTPRRTTRSASKAMPSKRRIPKLYRHLPNFQRGLDILYCHCFCCYCLFSCHHHNHRALRHPISIQCRSIATIRTAPMSPDTTRSMRPGKATTPIDRNKLFVRPIVDCVGWISFLICIYRRICDTPQIRG